jgi:hypothetical protein
MGMSVPLVMTASLLCLGCSSGKPKAIEDARRAPPSHDAGRPLEPGRPSTGLGDIQVRVEWVDAPAGLRRSPGRTPCKTARSPSISPTTTWGLPDVLVVVDGDPSALGEARVRHIDCALSPRIVTGKLLAIDSAMPRPTALALTKRGELGQLDKLDASATRTVMLPISGHTVTTELEPGGVYELSTQGSEPEVAWIVAGRGAITDAHGVVLVRDVPPGTHRVTAWLPARGGQPARRVQGEVVVVADDVADLTLRFAP